MGDDDNETIQNVSTAEWDFEDEAFDVVSDMSKKFIEELLIRSPESVILNNSLFHFKVNLTIDTMTTRREFTILNMKERSAEKLPYSGSLHICIRFSRDGDILAIGLSTFEQIGKEFTHLNTYSVRTTFP